MTDKPQATDTSPPAALTFPDMVFHTAQLYDAAGWKTISVYPLRSAPVDIIAKKDVTVDGRRRTRFHFVQVVPAEAKDTGKFIGVQRNEFVQNALSNQAEPIHANISAERKRDGTQKIKCVLLNVNTAAGVRI